MRSANIISAFQGFEAFEECKNTGKQITSPYAMSKSDAKALRSFCELLEQNSKSLDIFEGYFIGFSIQQISKEFDLLRFSDDLVIDIELKQHLDLPEDKKIRKILKQQSENYYYLRALQRDIFICTYVENDGLYEYDHTLNKYNKIDFEKLVHILECQQFSYDANPNKLFVPNNYLISPFNNTERFLNGEYFLTRHQDYIKKRVIASLFSKYMITCITADAGTGKTLLLYDIAKTISKERKMLLIHCGKLNKGHEFLKEEYNWNIRPIKDIQPKTLDVCIDNTVEVIFIDESQRINDNQLKLILEKSKELNIPILFSYDKKQYLRTGESKDIFEYLKNNYPEFNVQKEELTNKIRTNKSLSSFITNLFQIGKSNSDLNYSSVTIEYFEDLSDMKRHIKYLENNRDWTFITYTNSRYNPESIDVLSSLSDLKAHDVIGQEFNKVVFVMDDNFEYGDNGILRCNKESYYSLYGMFYQIVTRVISEMKIIVYKNKPLYYKLLEIKSFDKSND